MRTLALLLALVLAPQAALARVATFPETALRGDREISAIRVSASARQLADGRRETACFYDSTASAMTDDPINHRDPTGREDEPGAGVSDTDGAESLDVEDLLVDAGTTCTVGACYSEADISQLECLRTLGLAASAGFCAAQPEACVTLSAASACMSSGASEEDALVLGTAGVGEVVAVARAAGAARVSAAAVRAARIGRGRSVGLERMVNRAVARVGAAVQRVGNFRYVHKVASAASRLGVHLPGVEIKEGVARLRIGYTLDLAPNDITVLKAYLRSQGAKRVVVNSGTVVASPLLRTLETAAKSGKAVFGGGRVRRLERDVFEIVFELEQ